MARPGKLKLSNQFLCLRASKLPNCQYMLTTRSQSVNIINYGLGVAICNIVPDFWTNLQREFSSQPLCLSSRVSHRLRCLLDLTIRSCLAATIMLMVKQNCTLWAKKRQTSSILAALKSKPANLYSTRLLHTQTLMY